MGNCTGYVAFQEDSDDYYRPYNFVAVCELDTGHDDDHMYRLSGKDGMGKTSQHVTIQWKEFGRMSGDGN